MKQNSSLTTQPSQDMVMHQAMRSPCAAYQPITYVVCLDTDGSFRHLRIEWQHTAIAN